MGNGGLQLLQAAAAELSCVRLPVLRQLLGAHGLGSWGQRGQECNTEKPSPCPPEADHTTWRLFRFWGWWGSSWGRGGGLRAGDAGGGGGSSNWGGSLLSGVD